jgi:hypothetical protein
LDYREDDRLWSKDLKTNVAIIDLSIGQTIFNNSKHKITPFAGFGIMEFSVAEKEGEEYQDQRIVNYGVIYGLYYDLKFKKSIRITPSPFGGRSRDVIDQSIRVKLFATPGEFENMRGQSVNLIVAYAFFGRFIKIR